MSALFQRFQHLRTAVVTGLAACAFSCSFTAQAAPEQQIFSTGSGNVSVFDAAAGTGGWVGSVLGFANPFTAEPLELVSVVLFTIDNAADTVSGSFEFTSSIDLLSTITGTFTGTASDDFLLVGGQLILDYFIDAGTGAFGGAMGLGIGLLDYAPNAPGDNYSDVGIFVFTVPEPGSLALVGAGLLLLVGSRRVKAR